MAGAHLVLTLNAGSSSLKAAVYSIGTTEVLVASAQVERIGTSHARLTLGDASRDLGSIDHAGALHHVLEWLEGERMPRPLEAVVHRVVQGGDFTDPQRIGPKVIGELRKLVAVDPDHLPQTIEAIEILGRKYPDLPQIACFDTAFHRTLPPVARLLPLPSRFRDAGVRRYGFHGLSCEFILGELRAIDPRSAEGRLVIAHLGNGASMTAVRHGESVETTMGFSPAGGLMMGTRPGDLDPGVLLYAIRQKGMTPTDLDRLVNSESGLLGVSGTTADMHDLLGREATDPRAAGAVSLFCHLAKKSLGALMATLGGLDALVFTGGIGEHSGAIRERITAGLESFGLSIDGERNAANAPVISAGPVVIRVMATNEDLVLARHARRLLFSGQLA